MPPSSLRRPARSFRPTLEALERREVLATLTVLSAADSGAGSLRAALAAANPAGGDTIVFAPALAGRSIDLQSTLVVGHSVTVRGPGAGRLTLRRAAAEDFGVLDVGPGVTATVSGLTISNGSAPPIGGGGGGVYNEGTLTLTDCVVSDNHAASFGGGVSNASGAVLTLARDTITGNTVGNQINEFSIGFGGGIYNGGGSLTVLDSALVHNAADSGVAWGGGLFNDSGPVTLVNCTIADNVALGTLDTGGGVGGGAYFNSAQSGAALVLSCTIAGNSAGPAGAEGFGGGIYVYTQAPTLRNTIVADNAADQGPDIYGNLAAADYDLIGTTADGNYWLPPGGRGNWTGTDPRLGALQDNGGPTPTMALLPGSPALNAGGAAYLVGRPPHDQTGRPRVAGPAPDIGAYEVQPRAVAVALATSSAAAPLGRLVTFTARVTSPAGVPAGTVTFFADGRPLATVALVNGWASFSTAGLPAGWHTLRATYNGFAEGDFALDTGSAALVQFIAPPPRHGRAA